MADWGPFAWYMSSAKYASVTAWVASTAVAAGVLRRQLATPTYGNERVFVCIIAGTTLAAEPSWTVTKGAKTAEAAGPTWQECTGQPAVNGDDASQCTAATNATSAAGSFVLTFAAVPAQVAVGQLILNKTTQGVIPAQTKVVSFTSTTVTMSAAVTGAGVGNPNTIAFSNCPQWIDVVSTAVSLGYIVQNKTGGHLFIVSTAGTCAGTEPSFSTTTGNTTADNTVTWTCIGATGAFGDWAAPFSRCVTSFGTGWATLGSTVFAASDHAESRAGAVSITFPSVTTVPTDTCMLLCVGNTIPPTSGDITTGASITSTGANAVTLSGSIYANGMTVSSGSGATAIALTLQNSKFQMFENCALKKPGTTASAAAITVSGTGPIGVVLKNTTMEFGNTGDQILMGQGFQWFDTPTAIAGSIFPTSLWASAPYAFLQNVDLSALGTGDLGFATTITTSYNVTYANCKLASNYVLSDGNSTGRVSIINSGSSAINYTRISKTGFGAEIQDIVIVRTGGASDGTTPSSTKITTTANASWVHPYVTLPMAVWNATTGANRTVTLYGVWNSDRAPLDDEIWGEAQYFGSASSPQGSRKSESKATVLASGVSQTADTASAWDSLVTARANSTAYSLGDVRKVASNSGRIFFCTTAGTSSGSEPGGYASAVDGGSVTDNTAVFRAGYRFSMVMAITSPQPQMAGPFYVTVNAAKISSTFYVDPRINLS